MADRDSVPAQGAPQPPDPKGNACPITEDWICFLHRLVHRKNRPHLMPKGRGMGRSRTYGGGAA